MGDAPTLAEPSGDDTGPDLDAEPVDDGDDPETTVAEASDVLDDQPDDPPSDVNEATVELTDDDMGGGLFSGVEDAGDSSTSSEASSSDDGDGDDGGDGDGDDGLGAMADGLEGNAAAMEDAINDGAARLAVVGLTDSDFEDSDLSKDSLEDEFRETFAAFRLGYFGSKAAEEYVLAPADGDVSPVWGLAGSVLMAAAMIVWLRPDGDEAVAKARDAIGSLGGAA